MPPTCTFNLVVNPLPVLAHIHRRCGIYSRHVDWRGLLGRHKVIFLWKSVCCFGVFFKKQPKTIFSESAKKEIHNKKNGWNFFQRYKNMIFYDAHMNQRRKTIHLGQEGKRHFLFLGSFKFVESNDMSALLMWQLLLSGVLLDRSSDLLHAQFLL